MWVPCSLVHREEGKGEEGDASVGKLVKVLFLSCALRALREWWCVGGARPVCVCVQRSPWFRVLATPRRASPSARRDPRTQQVRNTRRLVLTAAARRR